MADVEFIITVYVRLFIWHQPYDFVLIVDETFNKRQLITSDK
jgi:hypothetical protein